LVPPDSVRLDKWLQVARLFKTRSQAAHACETGRVSVNGATAKAHRTVRLDDRVEIQIESWKKVVLVKGLREKPVSKDEARLLFEDVSPPRPVLDPLEQLMRRSSATRPRGSGRPTKRERRLIERLKDDGEG